jgi:hypothetical protein
MKKKSRIMVSAGGPILALLFITFLGLLGCPTESSDSTLETPYVPPSPAPQGKTPAQKAAELANALGNATGGGTVTVNGTTVKVETGSKTVSSSTIHAGVKLEVSNGATFEVTGTINNTGTIEVNGTYTLGAGVTGTNDGTVVIESGAVVRNGAGVNIGGTGTNIVKAGGTVYFNGDTVAYIGNNNAAKFNLTSGTFTYNNAGDVLEGTATHNDLDSTATWPPDVSISATDKFTIKRDSVLTIPVNGVGILYGGTSAASAPLVGDLTGSGNLPQIVISGVLWYGTSNTYRYFFDNISGPIPNNPVNDPIPAGTYNWDTTLNGWKAQ